MKPLVVCHMMPSLDGRLRVDRWDIPAAAEEEYDRAASQYLGPTLKSWQSQARLPV